MAGRSVISITMNIDDAKSKLELLKNQSKATFESYTKGLTEVITKEREFQKVQKELAASQAKLASMGKKDAGYAAQKREVDGLTKEVKKLDIELKSLRKTQASLNREQASSEKAVKAQERIIKGTKDEVKAQKDLSKALRTTTSDRSSAMNAMVRYIRKIESIIVALYGVKKAYDATLGVGHEYNKSMEQLEISMAAMYANSLKNVDISGKEVTAQQKLAEAHKIARVEMEKLRELNLQTPHDLEGTAKIYSTLASQALQYGASVEQIRELTKDISILGSVGRVQVPNIVATVDALFSGQMRASDMQRELKKYGVEMSEIRKLNKEGGDVMAYLLKKMKDVKASGKEIAASWDGVTNKFMNAWKDIWGQLQKPLFDSMKIQIGEFTKFFTENKDRIIAGLKEVGVAAVNLGIILNLRLLGMLKGKGAATALSTLKSIGKGGALLSVYFGEKLVPAVDRSKSALERFVGYFNLGVEMLKLGFWGFMETIDRGLKWMVANFLDIPNKITKAFENMYNKLAKGFAGMLNKMFGKEFNDYMNSLKVVFGFGTVSKYTPVKFKPISLGAPLRADRTGETNYDKIASDFTEKADKAAKAVMKAYEKLLPSYGPPKPPGQGYTPNIGFKSAVPAAGGDGGTAAANAAKHAADLQDKLAKKQMQIYKEQLKQEKILFEMGLKNGKMRLSLTSNTYEKAVEEVKLSEKLIAKNKELVKGKRSEEELQKETTKHMENQNRLLDAQLAEMQRWEGIFNSFSSGDFASGINAMFGDMFKSVQTSIGNMMGGAGSLMGQMAGGLAGFGIGFGLDMLMGTLSADKIQERPDTGVSEIKSDSIESILNNIYDVQYPMLEATRQMRDALVSSANAIDDFVAKISFGGLDIGKGLGDELSWTKSKSSYQFEATYLDLGKGALQEYLDGAISGYLATVMKYSKSGWLYDTVKYDTAKQYLNEETMTSIADAISSGLDAIFVAAGRLGIENVEDSVNSVILDLGKIDTTGLSETEAAERISQEIAYTIDLVAGQALGIVEPFRNLGETLYEATLRVATQADQAAIMFAQAGKDVSGWYESATIIQDSGGFDNFTKNMHDFIDLFSDEQQRKMKMDALEKQFQSLGVSMPKTTDAFIELVNNTTDPKLYSDLLSMSGAFGEIAKSADDLSSTLDRVVDAWMGNLSYLSLKQKAELASSYYGVQRDANSALKMVESAMKSTATREEYIPIFNKYIAELETEDGATLDDVVGRLDVLVNEVRELENTQRKLA